MVSKAGRFDGTFIVREVCLGMGLRWGDQPIVPHTIVGFSCVFLELRWSGCGDGDEWKKRGDGDDKQVW